MVLEHMVLEHMFLEHMFLKHMVLEHMFLEHMVLEHMVLGHTIETYGRRPHIRNIWPYTIARRRRRHASPIFLFVLAPVLYPLLSMFLNQHSHPIGLITFALRAVARQWQGVADATPHFPRDYSFIKLM